MNSFLMLVLWFYFVSFLHAQPNPPEPTDASDSMAESVTIPERETPTSPPPTPSVEDAATTNPQEVNQDEMASLNDSSAHPSTIPNAWGFVLALSCMGGFTIALGIY